MSRQPGNTLLGSLRGKIWISTSVLAFFISTFGLISYLVVSLLVNDTFYGIFIPFLLLAFTVMLFGWWLANEVVSPVENVNMLAQSMERSTSTSIPKTSGSTETDDLLKTIQRNNQQYQRLVVAMDHVANGNLDVKPLQGNDRLSAAFQKLLSRVGESISAKEELDELKEAMRALRMEVSGVRSGNLDVALKGEFEQTKELSATFSYLVENLRKLITIVQAESATMDDAAKMIEDDLKGLVDRDENRVLELSEASVVLKQVPGLINKISEDLRGSAKSARASIEKAKHGNDIAAKNSNSVSGLRKQIREDVKRLESLTERSHDIARVAKTVEDLANRTNMIALNASIQATELGEDGHGFVLVAEEVERLATRANGTNKQISTLNKSILAEIKKVENSIEASMSEVASLSKFAIEAGNVIGELERYVGHFLNLQENLIAYSNDQSEETDDAFATYAESIKETESTVTTLKQSARRLDAITKASKELKTITSEFRLTEPAEQHDESEEPQEFTMNPSTNDVPEESKEAEYNTEAFNAVRMDSEEFDAMSFEAAAEPETESVTFDGVPVSDEQGDESDSSNNYLDQLSGMDVADDSSQEEAAVPEFENFENEDSSYAEISDSKEEGSEAVELDSFNEEAPAFEGEDSQLSEEYSFEDSEFLADSSEVSQEVMDSSEANSDSFDSTELVAEAFDSSDFAPDTFNSQELAGESFELTDDALDEMSLNADPADSVEVLNDEPLDLGDVEGYDEELDDEVFDLYKASLSAQPDSPDKDPEEEFAESVFDSGEFKKDELIETSDDASPLHYDAPETNTNRRR